MIFNLSKQTRISTETRYANRIWERMRGMIGRSFDGFDAMVFPRCSAIHTFFMSMPIDVIFADQENVVVKVFKSLPTWRPCICVPRAVTVIEMPSGTLDKTPVDPGDKLDLSAELTTEGVNAVKKALFDPCCHSMEYSDLSRRKY